MAGICGIVSKRECVDDLFWKTFYLQHRSQSYSGLATLDEKRFHHKTHRGLIKAQFTPVERSFLKGTSGIGSVAGDRQPVSELSKSGGVIMGFDGNLINYSELKDSMLKNGETFSGYHDPDGVSDTVIVSKIIAKEVNFTKGVEVLAERMKGDYSIVALAEEGIYAARGWGRKPLILGEGEGKFAVSSESNSFRDIKIIRDVEPGEIVLITKDGVNTVKKLGLNPIKYGTFEWVYSAHPPSVIDGRTVKTVRNRIGAALARRYPVKADIVSPVPNSGRHHAIGYSHESGIPYDEIFVRYDYSDRSYTPGTQEDRDLEARTKLTPIEEGIAGKIIVLVDDSIVRGTQLLNRVKELKRLGAKEVHLRIASSPLMRACYYGKTTRNDNECIARRMSTDDIQTSLGVESLGYATIEDLGDSIQLPLEQLCLECWLR